jgi:hypothetical protein
MSQKTELKASTSALSSKLAAANQKYIVEAGLAADSGCDQHDRERVHGPRGPPAEIDPAELIPAKQAAELLHLRVQTLASWRSVGRGPRWFKIGRAAFYRLADIRSWLAAQGQEPRRVSA